jgi:hypothetical protein
MPGEAYPIETTGRDTPDCRGLITQNQKRFKFHHSEGGNSVGTRVAKHPRWKVAAVAVAGEDA